MSEYRYIAKLAGMVDSYCMVCMRPPGQVPVVLVIIIRLRERKDAVGLDHVVLGMRLFVEMVG